MKDLYTENYDTDERNWARYKIWKDISCPGTSGINIIKVSVLPKAIYKFGTILINISMANFTELEKNHSKICVETQKTPISQTNIEQEEQCWSYHTSWFQPILRSYINQNCKILAQIQT